MTSKQFPGRLFILRHGETIYNKHRRLQANGLHTPLTLTGVEQAKLMGAALQTVLGHAPALSLHVARTGRAMQTLSILCEVLGLDYFAAHADPRLNEIDMGDWCEWSYGDLEASVGPIIDPATRLLREAPGGERYGDIADRLGDWLEGLAHDGFAQTGGGDRLVVMHGISSRVLRGLLTDLPILQPYGVAAGEALPQGSIVMIEGGAEQIIHRGVGVAHA